MAYVFVLISLVLSFSAQASDGKFEMSANDYSNGVMVTVPAGNMNSAQKDYDDGKYQNIMWIISHRENACVIKQAAALYNVDPVAIMGSIVGEHTFNVDAWDIAQENYLYMVKRWISRFQDNGLDLIDILAESNYAQCKTTSNNDYQLWNCYNSIWETDKRNPRRGANNWEIKWTFFNPTGAGYTYGFGQFGPDRAVMVTDLVHQVSGFPEVSIEDPNALYDAILNPETSIHYVAATNRVAIDAYARVAHFDISENPGVIATLYNLGREEKKAEDLYGKTIQSLLTDGTARYPQVNFYGWFVNKKAKEIRAVYDKSVSENCP